MVSTISWSPRTSAVTRRQSRDDSTGSTLEVSRATFAILKTNAPSDAADRGVSHMIVGFVKLIE